MSKTPKAERRLLTDIEIAALPRAGLLRRLAALLYDMFLVAAMWILLGFAIQFIFGFFADNTSELVDGQVQTHPVLLMINFAMMVSSAGNDCVAYTGVDAGQSAHSTPPGTDPLCPGLAVILGVGTGLSVALSG